MEEKSGKITRIVVLGPESTGKTTLCMELAEHFNMLWMPEFAREYVEKLKRPYTKEDVLHIACKQIEMEEEYSHKASVLILDTDLIITKVWLLHVYKDCPDWINDALRNAHPTHYLVCKPDLPWEFDPVRENPDLREYLMEWYCREIEYYGFSYSFVSGTGKQRTESAIKTLVKILNPETNY
jgi:nicotinamide riboside kinase